MTTLPPEDMALLFFNEIARPTVDEFLAAPADKRRGCLACLAVAAITEHYFQSRPELVGVNQRPRQALEAFKVAIHEENGAVGWIADVANATKHVVRDGKRGAAKIRYGDVRAIATGQCGVMRCGWPLGEGEEIVVGSNLEWRLSTLIEAAMDFWRAKLGLPTDVAPA